MFTIQCPISGMKILVSDSGRLLAPTPENYPPKGKDKNPHKVVEMLISIPHFRCKIEQKVKEHMRTMDALERIPIVTEGYRGDTSSFNFFTRLLKRS